MVTELSTRRLDWGQRLLPVLQLAGRSKRSVEDGSATARAWTADDLRRVIEERSKAEG